MRSNREHFWRDRQPCLKEQSDAQACIKLIVQLLNIRERNIVSVSSNFLTQISCGTSTKCRKTRAMQRNFTIVDSLALRQLRHFDDSGHSLAKITFPDTILSLAQFSASKNKRLLNGSVSGNLKASLSVGKHFIVQGFCNNERYQDMQAVNLKMVYSCSILCR